MLKPELNMMLAMQDDDFQKILQEDKIIEQLEKEKFSTQDQYLQLMYVFSGEFEISEVRFKVLTLGMWCFLYSIKNAFTISEKATKTDIDIFMYLLHHGYQGVSDQLFAQAQDFCEKNNISYETALKNIHKVISISFRPMELIPSVYITGQQNHFNLQWLTSVISSVCRYCNCTREYVLYKMSMVQAFYYLIQQLKENDTKNQIKRRNSAEIDAEIYKRTLQLGKKYYQEKYKD